MNTSEFDFGKSLNQPPILENYNLFASDLPLQTAVEANGGAFNNENTNRFGKILGSAETLELGNLANKHPPVLLTHDRFGNRLDLVEFHPAYHALMQVSMLVSAGTDHANIETGHQAFLTKRTEPDIR